MATMSPILDGVTCEGAGCAARAHRSGRRTAPPRVRLCPRCRDALDAELRRLPGLYAECENRLGPSGSPVVRRPSGRVRGETPFNAAAAECRSQILGVLASWAGLTAEARRVTAPRRAVPRLSAFLRRHLDWLARHPAVGDLSVETARLVRTAERVTGADPVRRVHVGSCVETGCRGTLTAYVTPDRRRPPRITCDAEPEHSWAGGEWLNLGRRIAETAPSPPSGREPRPRRWLSPADICCLWNIPRGSVYRLASERRWRRRKVDGRTYYAEPDVRLTLRDR
ncbi:hypothetical protein SAMN04489712_11631 [Thermomonospora echinospora]|uniref:Helix-turn-helix domain-containing protein n=1 Tax=Thermomonospora echinospora TaxID=1992 RepID=A0A1H6DDZ0_9ACTN|nr:hypothetical protein [Thermomonospora echinospora]SEG83588.1 hypothetical protein SAMN04489712_11631 [Thermomonospora echinospora]